MPISLSYSVFSFCAIGIKLLTQSILSLDVQNEAYGKEKMRKRK